MNSASAVPSTPAANRAPEPVPDPAASALAASTGDTQPLLHPFSGIPNHYIPPNTYNFAAPDKHQDGAYRRMPPIYDIEQIKAVFDCILQTRVTVSFYNTITPKHNLATNVVTAKELSEHNASIEDILPTFAYNNATFSLSSNTATAQSILEMLAPVTAIDLVEAYIDIVHDNKVTMLEVVVVDGGGL
ncbi:hypothetical protein E4T56_gene13360 [Termitomyces sp. T112]|nr:hypothetical protein E4T56_gene13360 [Termitomyces sp. T112]